MEKIDAIFDGFVYLISKYGKRGTELRTFDYCTNYGCSLADSTIDKITYNHDTKQMLFFYNENTCEFDNYDTFNHDDLRKFYIELIEAIDDEKSFNGDMIRILIVNMLCRIFDDKCNADKIADDIFDDVVEDVRETAGDEWNDYDVEIAVQRVLLEKLGY